MNLGELRRYRQRLKKSRNALWETVCCMTSFSVSPLRSSIKSFKIVSEIEYQETEQGQLCFTHKVDVLFDNGDQSGFFLSLTESVVTLSVQV